MPGDNPHFYDNPRRGFIPLSAREWEAFDKIHAEMWPDRSEEEVLRKLVQDALIGCGVLDLPAANRSQGARRK